MPQLRSSEKLERLFTKKTVVDLPGIQRVLGEVSIQTAFRYLKLVPYRRSYNHNGRYYAWYEASRFDRMGLWSFDGIHFSIDGSLANTVRRLVHEAPAGVSHRELQVMLQVRVHNTLLELWQKDEITRESLAGFFIYLHKEGTVREAQLVRDLEKQPAEVALVHNLQDSEYVRLLAGSLENLPAAFALLNQNSPTQTQPLTRDHRNSELQRALRQLLGKPVPLPSDSRAEQRRASPNLLTPSITEIAATAQELETLSDIEIRTRATAGIAKSSDEQQQKPRDPRLPPPGAVLARQFGFCTYYVHVQEEGLLWGSNTYATPTKVVKAINGTGRNGFDFFGLTMPWPERATTLRGRRLNRYTSIDLPATTES